MLYIIVFLSLCGSLLCHDVEIEFVNKRPKIHEHKLTMRELSSVKSEDNSNRFEIDKIDDYFNIFRSDLDALNQKKLHKQLSNLVNDVEHHLRKSGLINNANVNEFINTGLKNIHKKFNFNRHIEEFLLSQKNNEANYFLHSNSLGDELMKAKDWNSKKNGPKRVKVEEKPHERILVNNQPPKVQEQVQDPLVDRKQASYSKKDYFQNNVKYMRHRYHDVHPKFTDQDPMKNDLFDDDDSF